MTMRRYMYILNEAAPTGIIFYHGTERSKVRSILKQGLLPSKRAPITPDSADNRWATLGGVYLTRDFAHAVMIAIQTDADIAVVVAQVSPQSGTPDEDVIEKALVKSFTSALDAWGIDDAFDADLDLYAEHERQRPRDEDEQPFDRSRFFHEFWATVKDNMARIAGKPRSDPGAKMIERAIDLSRAVQEEPTERTFEEWQQLKDQLVWLYPKLRLPGQHAQSGLTIPHNIRLTRPLGFRGRNRIVAIVVPNKDDELAEQDIEHWTTIYGALPATLAS